MNSNLPSDSQNDVPESQIDSPEDTKPPRRRKRVTDKQLAANRANASKSTGPKTAEGKRRCALNALRHGLTAQVTMLPEQELVARFEFTLLNVAPSVFPVLADTAAFFISNLGRVSNSPLPKSYSIAEDVDSFPEFPECETAGKTVGLLRHRSPWPDTLSRS